MRVSLPRAACAIALVALLVAGCKSGPKMVKVTGRFVANGQAVTYPKDTYVTLMFIPVSEGMTKRQPATVNGEAGTFAVELAAGQYQVSFSAIPTGVQIGDMKNIPKPPTGGAGSGETFDLTAPKVLDIPVPAPMAPKK